MKFKEIVPLELIMNSVNKNCQNTKLINPLISKYRERKMRASTGSHPAQ